MTTSSRQTENIWAQSSPTASYDLQIHPGGFAEYPVYPGAQPRPDDPGSVTNTPLPADATDVEAV